MDTGQGKREMLDLTDVLFFFKSLHLFSCPGNGKRGSLIGLLQTSRQDTQSSKHNAVKGLQPLMRFDINMIRHELVSLATQLYKGPINGLFFFTVYPSGSI